MVYWSVLWRLMCENTLQLWSVQQKLTKQVSANLVLWGKYASIPVMNSVDLRIGGEICHITLRIEREWRRPVTHLTIFTFKGAIHIHKRNKEKTCLQSRMNSSLPTYISHDQHTLYWNLNKCKTQRHACTYPPVVAQGGKVYTSASFEFFFSEKCAVVWPKPNCQDCYIIFWWSRFMWPIATYRSTEKLANSRDTWEVLPHVYSYKLSTPFHKTQYTYSKVCLFMP